jgi:hypothetical protein
VTTRFDLVLPLVCVSKSVRDSLAAGPDGVARCGGAAGTRPQFAIGRLSNGDHVSVRVHIAHRSESFASGTATGMERP